MEGGKYKIQEVKGLEIDLLPPVTCLRSTDVTLVKWKGESTSCCLDSSQVSGL